MRSQQKTEGLLGKKKVAHSYQFVLSRRFVLIVAALRQDLQRNESPYVGKSERKRSMKRGWGDHGREAQVSHASSSEITRHDELSNLQQGGSGVRTRQSNTKGANISPKRQRFGTSNRETERA